MSMQDNACVLDLFIEIALHEIKLHGWFKGGALGLGHSYDDIN